MEKINREQAIKEIQDLVLEHTFESKTSDEIEKEYPQLLKGIIDGKVELGEKPKFELYKTIKDDEGNDAVTSIEFKTRIKPLDMARITKGIDMQKDIYNSVILMNCHLSGLGKGLYNNLSKIDEKIVSQMCSIFL